ncbi:MAG: mandelate racemase/muconate lactonizing enzyme family protein [Chloroflexota bacterium]
MRITNLEAFSVAIPFQAPIFSAYGVSYPARLRTIIRLTTDDGLTGIGEAGVSATHTVQHREQERVFERVVKPVITGCNPFDYLQIMGKLRYMPEALAVEIACWDLMGKATGLPVYRLLGGAGHREDIPHAAYFFFRGAGRDGGGAVTLDNYVDHVRCLMDTYGFRTIKLKLGVYDPATEAEVTRKVREAIGPRVQLRVDSNGCWSLPTALRFVKEVEDLDLEYIEEPIKFIPARVMYATLQGAPSIDPDGLARLRQASRTPIALDNAYRIDFVPQVFRAQAADIMLGDIQGCGGIRGLFDYYALVQLLGLTGSMHSGTEIGIGQAAKLHVAAARPELTLAVDAIYHEYTDDVLVGGKLPYVDGGMKVPQSPGLGVELDEARLAKHELTEARHRELDAYYAEIKGEHSIPPAGPDLLVRHF